MTARLPAAPLLLRVWAGKRGPRRRLRLLLLLREEERMRLELEERERLEREREAREAFERKLRDLSRKTSGGDETAWVQGSDASEEGTPRHPDAMNGKDDRKKRPPPNDFQ